VQLAEARLSFRSRCKIENLGFKMEGSVLIICEHDSIFSKKTKDSIWK
jgi:hypothetical protein